MTDMDAQRTKRESTAAAKATAVSIVEVAREQIRFYGYKKMMVANVAKELRMSPANVYRFFSSKHDLLRTVFRQYLSQSHDHLSSVAGRQGGSIVRLRRCLIACYWQTIDLRSREPHIYELIRVGFTRAWDLLQAHVTTAAGLIARVIREGIIERALEVSDTEKAARNIVYAAAQLWHPDLLMADFRKRRDRKVSRLVSFLVSALRTKNIKTGLPA